MGYYFCYRISVQIYCVRYFLTFLGEFSESLGLGAADKL